MYNFVDVNFKFDIFVGVLSFRNVKFEPLICNNNYQFFFDISKLKAWFKMLLYASKLNLINKFKGMNFFTIVDMI